ncbi:unnamed protein product [marine sediment metagenome]|uniref:Glycosyl transferase family 1 domain-containing protein n=1 Tax=marine sediment metagenome TaxID=412755 RepID=X0Z8D9_9ZZZZ
MGIIPFKKNALTDAINPVKLYEYFASGLPVVTVNLSEVINLNSPTLISRSKDGFVAAIKKALQVGRGRKEFYEFAKGNSWSIRFSEVKDIITQKMQ